MTRPVHTIRAQGAAATLDLSIGHLVSFEVARDGRTVSPLHRAPWADDAEVPREADTAPNLIGLGGDFLCAPFGGNDVVAGPSHGLTANTPWRLDEERTLPGGGVTARFVLESEVFGARVLKELTLRDGHPFLYQRHLFVGGEGAITAAHHVNIRFGTTGRLDFSPKAFADVPTTPLEPDPARGRYVLDYPARSDDLSALPLKAGGTADLHRYPIGDRHEDFVMLVEAPDSPLGWTTALREDQRDLLIVLKRPSLLPVTLLWFSNGGRDYAPWNGRHVGVLGIEDARTYSLYGHRASIEPNPLTETGVPTSFSLTRDGEVEIRHVIGALPAPYGWQGTRGIAASAGRLQVLSAGGDRLNLSFDDGFLAAHA